MVSAERDGSAANDGVPVDQIIGALVANGIAFRSHQSIPVSAERVCDFARLTIERNGEVVDANVVGDDRRRRVVANLNLNIRREGDKHVERNVVRRGSCRCDLRLIRCIPGCATRGA